MNSFLKKIMLFLMLCITLSLFIVIIYGSIYKVSFKDIPAPHLSDSYSLNEKIEFLRQSRGDQHFLVVGSSIALNNLSSETIFKNIQPKTFLNASSWGMNMEDNFHLFKILCEKYHPDKLILPSSISEFEMPPKLVDYSVVKKYLDVDNFRAMFYHITFFNLRYYMDNTKYKKSVTERQNQYEDLVFDAFGGVNIDKVNFTIDKNRWNFSFESDKIKKSQYDYLDSIAVFCKLKNVELVFFQSPFRKGVYEKLETSKVEKLNEHILRIASILKKSNHVLIDANNRLWNDSLFLDSEHLNKIGAAVFTSYCFKQLDSLNKAN